MFYFSLGLTLTKLETECLKPEEGRRDPIIATLPPGKERSHVNLEFDYVSSSDIGNFQTISAITTSSTSNLSQPTSGLQCCNCDKTGHKFSKCPCNRKDMYTAF